MPSNLEKENTGSPTTPDPAVESTASDVNCVPEASLPKLVVCFDISTLTLENLKTIAKDLKIPGYTHMTKEQLCEVLLAL